MSHPGELLSAYLDGELTRSEVERLVEHLSGCGRCSSELQELGRVRSAVRSLPRLEVPAGLVPGLEAEVVPLHRNRGFLVGAAAAAAAVIIAIATMLTPEPATVSVEELEGWFGARASLDPAFGPAKVVVPELDRMLE